MAADSQVTIFHNPACGTSRNVLGLIEGAGVTPEIVLYLKTGWTKTQLKSLLRTMKARPRDILRRRGTPAEELGLLAADVSDEAILDAMVAHPVLVERPIVVTPRGAKLCRPAEAVKDLL